MRRLKERLGIGPGSNKFRGIATSASIPALKGAEANLARFAADLFGEPEDSFTLIHAGVSDEKPTPRARESQSHDAFSSFHESFTADGALAGESAVWPNLWDLANRDEKPGPAGGAVRDSLG